MPRKGYEAILKHLKLTTSPPLAFKHPFYPVNDLIDALHKHTKALLQSKVGLLFGQVHVGLDEHVDVSWLDVCSAKAPSNGEPIPFITS
jgi:hypothetical protein